MPKISPLQPRKVRVNNPYYGLESAVPQFRSGTQRVQNGKPNRGPSARATMPFQPEALVPFPFIGSDRKRIAQKRNARGQFVHESRYIPTPVKPPVKRKVAWWVNDAEV